MMTLVVLAAVEKLGVKTTSFVAVIGAAGLAIGLALQGSWHSHRPRTNAARKYATEGSGETAPR